MLSRKEIIEKLISIKKLYTESYDSMGIITHRFSGKVKTERPSEKEIIFYEHIRWENEDSLLINARNIYRWTFISPGKIKLEHLRFGENKPLFLVELSKVKKNTWESIEPHNCNNDLYSAELSMNDENTVLSWSVKGPTENYSLKTIYSH